MRLKQRQEKFNHQEKYRMHLNSHHALAELSGITYFLDQSSNMKGIKKLSKFVALRRIWSYFQMEIQHLSVKEETLCQVVKRHE